MNMRAAVFVDVDGDGADEVLLTWDGLARWFRWQPATGTWTELQTGLPAALPTVQQAVASDLDADGDLDLVCAGQWIVGGTAQVLWNDGTGGFTAAQPFGAEQSSARVIATDLDGDGDDDLVFAGADLRVWRNEGNRVFRNRTSTLVPPGLGTVTEVAAGDFDRDGTQDLVVESPNFGNVLLLNDGTGLFSTAFGRVPNGIGVAASWSVCDVDDDGDLDLWRGTINHGRPVLLENDGQASFTDLHGRVPALVSWQSQTRAADLDGDGDPELLLAGILTPPTILWNRHRHVDFAAPPTVGTAWHVDVFGQPGYGMTTRIAVLAIGLSVLPHPRDLAPFGRLGIDPAGPMAWSIALLQPFDGPVPFAVPVPPLPQLVGLPVAVQGLVEDAPGLASARFTALRTTWVR
jgi:hypothetical protein